MVSDGLPQSQIAAVHGDTLGNIWLGTIGGGISSFDGKAFSKFNLPYGLPNDIVMDILPSKNGIWVATQKGISLYENHKFKNYLITPSSGFYPKKVFMVGDTLFFTSTNGSVGMVLNDSLYQNVDFPTWQGITSVVKSVNNIFVVHQVTKGSHRIVIIQNGRPRVVKSNFSIKSLFSFFRYKNEWLISTNNGLYSVRGDSVENVRDFTFPIFRFIESTQSFVGKDNGQLVMITGNVRQSVCELEALVGTIYNDEDGTTWLGTDKGLYEITSPGFIKISEQAKSNPVMSVHWFRKHLWVGTSSQGVQVYKNQEMVNQLNLGSPRKNYVTSIKSDNDGALYFGTGGGVARYSIGGEIEWLAPSLVESSASLAIDANKRVVVASTVVGAYEIIEGKATVLEGLKNDVIQSIDYNQSLDVFAFGTNEGLRTMKGTQVTAIKIPELENVQLSSVRWVSNDSLAIGTYGKGFFLYSFGKGEIVSAIDELSGLSSNTIFLIYPAGNKYWIGTIMGLDLIEIKNGIVHSVTHFDETDGLIGLETNQDAVLNVDSTLYFGLVSGLYKFNKSIPGNPYPLHFTDIKLFYTQSLMNLPTTRTEFKNNENHFTFEFNKVNKRNPKSVFYRYKLEGFDQVWSSVSPFSTATYGNLPPGNFTFKVESTDKSGTFRYDGIQYHFTVLPPFYLAWWFKAIGVVSILSIALLIIYGYNKWRSNRDYYLQKLKEIERDRLRKEIARDFHDELGNQVARMINYIGLMRISNELKSNAYETLSNYSQTILYGTKDFVWALDPANDDLSNVLTYLKDFGERMFQEKDMKFSFHGDVSIPQKLPMGYGRQINLIFKEAMTNAFRHSNATEVIFEVIREERVIRVILKDNGKGIEPSENLSTPRGLKNMSVRAKRIHARIIVRPVHPGTEVELELSNTTFAMTKGKSRH